MTQPKCRWLRYSLRALLLFTLALSVWLGGMANRAAKQRRAVALVRDLDGVVLYECEWDGEPHLGPMKWGGSDGMEVFFDGPSTFGTALHHGVLPCPSYWYDFFDHDWYHEVRNFHVTGSNATDESLAELIDGFPNVVGIGLVDCPVTDAGLNHLELLESLEAIAILGSTCMTEDGIASLRQTRPSLKVIRER